MSRAHHRGSAPTQRMLRVAEQVRHVVSELLARAEIDDSELTNQLVSISAVKMSPDLKLAVISIVSSGQNVTLSVLAALERHKKFIRSVVAQQLNLKFAPDLKFRADTGLEAEALVDTLLNSPHVRQDLVSQNGTDKLSRDDETR